MKFSALSRLLALLFCCGMQAAAAAADSNDVLHFKIEGYIVSDTIVTPALNGTPMFSAHTGTNASMDEIARAAADLQADYAKRGYPAVGVVIGARDMTNGFVVMQVVRSAVPQIVIFGKRYMGSSNEVAEIAEAPVAAETNSVTPVPPVRPPKPLSPEQEALRRKLAELAIAERKALLPPQPPPTKQLILASPRNIYTNDVDSALRDKMAELENTATRAALLPPPTNSPAAPPAKGPVFEVKGFEVTGNTLMASNAVDLILQPYIGTNVTFERIRQALTDLQIVYREHGFATVSVTLPQQTLSDKIVKIRVFEGRLEELKIVNNRYFSSNNIMRALPSLHANMILNAPVFQSELDRANANQDRQIYPAIEPGLVEGTSLLKLDVKDRPPFHAKTELNNANSPGTPDLRINSSAEYKNLWQLEHSVGVQYSFSPELYKTGPQWYFPDKPLVANYSGFYRMPIGNPEAVANTISASTRFGYDEATRKFNLPAPSGQPELNFFASRSTIDTGLETSPEQSIFNVPGVRQVTRQDFQQDLTVNNALGLQFTAPLPENEGLRSTWSAGLTYKTYQLTSTKTNTFRFKEITVNADGSLNPPIISTVSSPVPLTDRTLEYLPLSLRYDGSRQDGLGATAFGIGLTVNAWYSGSVSNLHNVTGSTNSTGHWITINPTLTRDFKLPKNWTLSLHTEAQWASEHLVSNEQFGSGGVNSVRGYAEGEVFGDQGWRVDADLKTPPHVVGIAFGKQALTVRGSIFTDYSEVYLLTDGGSDIRIPLWSAGIGCVASVGAHWESRLLLAMPFERTTTTVPFQPKFNFSLTAQF